MLKIKNPNPMIFLRLSTLVRKEYHGGLRATRDVKVLLTKLHSSAID
jgi:hypothetical protein